jgi:hypothetical protein
MAGEVIEMHPVSRITIDAIGQPGQRVFLLQAVSTPDLQDGGTAGFGVDVA